VTKRRLDIDDDVLAAAKAVLGASTTQETVNRSLQAVLDANLRRRHVQRLATMEGLDLNDDEVMSKAWR